MDAIKSIMDIMLDAGIPAAAFERNLAHQRDGHLRADRPKSASILEVLRIFATDPQRAASREQLRRTLGEPPKGQA